MKRYEKFKYKINNSGYNNLLDDLDYEILKISENISFNKEDFENIDVELNDFEKKRITASYRKKINSTKYKLKKVVIAGGAAILICTACVICTPVNASKVPVLNSVYDSLGIYKEYKDYSSYIGETKKDGKYTYTIEEIVITPHKALASVKIQSDETFNDDENISFMMNLKIGGVRWNGATGQNYKLNDNTIINVTEYEFEDTVPRKADIELNIHTINCSNENDENSYVDFVFKANFEKSYNKYTSMKISNMNFKNERVNLKEINSSIMGTNLVSNISAPRDNVNSYVDIWESIEYVVKVDNKYYGGLKSSNIGSSYLGYIFNEDRGITTTHINNLKYDEFKNAKDITVIAYKSEEIQGENNDYDEKDTIEEQGIIYKKEYKFVDGSIGRIDKVNRENNKITFEYSGKEEDIVALTRCCTLYTQETENQKTYYPIIYKGNENNKFIIEFNNVDDDRTLIMTPFSDAIKKYTKIRETNIK